MELACELNDNDPWTLLSGAHYSALCGSIEQARSRAERALALSPAPSLSRMGVSLHGPFLLRRLCRGHRGLRSRGRDQQDFAGMARGIVVPARACHARRRKKLSASLMDCGRSGSDHPPPTDEAVARWVMQAHPISVKERWEALRDSLRGAGLPVEGIVHLSRSRLVQEQIADRVVADTFGVHPNFSSSGITGSMPLNRRL